METEILKGLFEVDNFNIDDYSIYGFINCKLDVFMKCLRAMGYSFSVRSSKQIMGVPKFLHSGIKFNDFKPNIKIPFSVRKKTFYDCANGKLYYRLNKKNMMNRMERSLLTRNSSLDCIKKCKRDTKKCNCAAKMQVVNLHFYPGFELSAADGWRKSSKVLRDVKSGLSLSPYTVAVEEKCYVHLLMTHNHPLESELSNRVSVARKISWIISDTDSSQEDPGALTTLENNISEITTLFQEDTNVAAVASTLENDIANSSEFEENVTNVLNFETNIAGDVVFQKNVANIATSEDDMVNIRLEARAIISLTMEIEKNSSNAQNVKEALNKMREASSYLQLCEKKDPSLALLKY